MSVPSDVELTLLGLADLDRLAALHHAAFPPGQAWGEDAFADLLKLAAVRCFALRQADQLLSILLVQHMAEQAEILTIATDPAARRKGYAKILMDLAAKDLQPKGAQTWLLDVAADNAGAIAFYEKLGFARDGQRPRYYKRLEGQRVDAILMSMPMGGQTIR
ncbi:MAG: N-acetyltransferase [Pseudomonadota bacterium]